MVLMDLLSVSDQRIHLPLLDEFQNAAEEFGIPKTKDFNTGDNHGCGYFQVTEKDGFRCSTSVGYLNPIKHRKNLKIITKAHIKKINFEKKTAKEVEFWHGDELKKVRANREIIYLLEQLVHLKFYKYQELVIQIN